MSAKFFCSGDPGHGIQQINAEPVRGPAAERRTERAPVNQAPRPDGVVVMAGDHDGPAHDRLGRHRPHGPPVPW
ncbi:hypothetical protein [Streptomyces sp. NPDC002785]|uniref:hypothetical protein n=1 Tax=Streptomyces sp. NPDC002785 TaxID=3154543 RepID=UPI003322EE6F